MRCVLRRRREGAVVHQVEEVPESDVDPSHRTDRLTLLGEFTSVACYDNGKGPSEEWLRDWFDNEFEVRDYTKTQLAGAFAALAKKD